MVLLTHAQKVRYLIDGIKTANLETCIETITTNDALREDFFRTARHIMDFLVRQKARNPNHNISVSILAKLEAGARVEEEETAESEVIKSVEVRVPLADHASVLFLRPGVISPGATYTKFYAAEQQKFYQNKEKYGCDHGSDRPDEPHNGGDRTMSELSNVRLMNLEDNLIKIAKVTSSARKRIRAAEEDNSRKDILASSNDYDSLNLSETANGDNCALRRQPKRGRERS